jgi:hypothetical protein
MSSWAAVLALTGFGYSGVEKSMSFAPKEGNFFWSNGYAWGSCSIKRRNKEFRVELSVLYGELVLSKFKLRSFGFEKFDKDVHIKAGEKAIFNVAGTGNI